MFTKISGFALLIIGLIIIIYAGINMVTKEKKIVELGQVEISVEKNNPVNWTPILGAVAFVGGFLILLFDKKESS